MNLIKRTIIIPATGLLLLSGCADHSAKDAISKFQTASAVVIANAEAEYTSANKKERDAEIDTRIYLGEQIDPGIFAEEELIVITNTALKARINALDALTKHGKLLFDLVNSDTPNEAKKAITSFDDAVLKLSSSLKQEPSSSFKTKAGAFATIAGELTKLVMQKKINEALYKAIILSENDVSSLIDLLQNEMLIEFPKLQRGMMSNTVSAIIKSYNKELPSDLEKRKKAGVEIKKAGDDWEALSSRPDPGFATMRKAHEKLVKYARSPKTPQNLEELVAAMDAFAEQAKIIADSIRTIQKTKE